MRRSMLCFAITFVACGGEILDETEETESELSATGGVTIVQVNPFKGGRFDEFGPPGEITFRTARRFARMLDQRYRRASVIGMQEATSARDSERFRQILEEE